MKSVDNSLGCSAMTSTLCLWDTEWVKTYCAIFTKTNSQVGSFPRQNKVLIKLPKETACCSSLPAHRLSLALFLESTLQRLTCKHGQMTSWVSHHGRPPSSSLFHHHYCWVSSSGTQPEPAACECPDSCLGAVAKLQHVFGECHPGNSDGWVCDCLICGSGAFTFAFTLSSHQTDWS